MKIFLSWSGEKSKQVALALNDWLPCVIQSVKPWLSETDIAAGQRWNAALSSELEGIDFGIICLTRSNLEKPWLLFEAGALSKSIEDSRVVPFRFDIEASEVGLPLSQFQGVDAEKQGTRKLLTSINQCLPAPLEKETLDRVFKSFWPDLEAELTRIRTSSRNEESKPESGSDFLTADQERVDYLVELGELIKSSQGYWWQFSLRPEESKTILSFLRLKAIHGGMNVSLCEGVGYDRAGKLSSRFSSNIVQPDPSNDRLVYAWEGRHPRTEGMPPRYEGIGAMDMKDKDTHGLFARAVGNFSSFPDSPDEKASKKDIRMERATSSDVRVMNEGSTEARQTLVDAQLKKV